MAVTFGQHTAKVHRFVAVDFQSDSHYVARASLEPAILSAGTIRACHHTWLRGTNYKSAFRLHSTSSHDFTKDGQVPRPPRPHEWWSLQSKRWQQWQTVRPRPPGTSAPQESSLCTCLWILK